MTLEPRLCRDSYARALAGAPEKTHTVSLAGVRFAFHFATEEAERTFFPALVPFETDAGEADELVYVWFGNGESLDSRLIPEKLPENMHHYHRVSVERESFISRCSPVTGVYWLHDAAACEAYAFYPSAQTLMGYEMSSPLLSCLYFILKRYGVLALHAGAVGDGKNAALLVGRGGSGKSSVCLAAMHAGMAFFGDDYVLLTSDNLVYPLYSSVKLHEDMAGVMHPDDRRWFNTDDGRNKRVYLLDKTRLCLKPLKVDVLLLCRVEHLATPAVERCPASRLLPELAFNAMQQMFDPDPAVFARIAALLNEARPYVLRLSDDPTQAVGVIQKLLFEVRP